MCPFNGVANTDPERILESRNLIRPMLLLGWQEAVQAIKDATGTPLVMFDLDELGWFFADLPC